MKHHQRYFHTFDNKGNITNQFLVVANNKDIKGFIKSGNERVVEARLNDAEFFWEKNKSQNLVKQITKLKNMNYFKGLGSYFDKIQRMRKLGGIISDELLISKEKVELSSSICKVDLMSDLVGEFPELQGIMGGYFAEAQGFDKDISEKFMPPVARIFFDHIGKEIAILVFHNVDGFIFIVVGLVCNKQDMDQQS
jgi:glycyl-tRNA synthetase beta chain